MDVTFLILRVSAKGNKGKKSMDGKFEKKINVFAFSNADQYLIHLLEISLLIPSLKFGR